MNKDVVHTLTLAEWTVPDHVGGVGACFVRYEVALARQTPSWADTEAIETIYRQAQRMTKETGVPHDVDHVIPLQGKLVSGLHVVENLAVIPRFANRSKSNKFD